MIDRPQTATTDADDREQADAELTMLLLVIEAGVPSRIERAIALAAER